MERWRGRVLRWRRHPKFRRDPSYHLWKHNGKRAICRHCSFQLWMDLRGCWCWLRRQRLALCAIMVVYLKCNYQRRRGLQHDAQLSRGRRRRASCNHGLHISSLRLQAHFSSRWCPARIRPFACILVRGLQRFCGHCLPVRVECILTIPNCIAHCNNQHVGLCVRRSLNLVCTDALKRSVGLLVGHGLGARKPLGNCNCGAHLCSWFLP